MSTKVRTISVNLNAGTAKFFSDLDAASGKIKQFGSHGVSSMQATSGAIRELEGNFTNNIRAVERFLATTLHLGPVLQAAFPLIGGIAFGGMVVELSAKVFGFFKTMQEAPEKIRGSFRVLNESLKLTNDGLDVTNARLENEIAKLEGRHENTLKLVLAEAKEAADRLSQSLDKDLESLNKLLKAQEGSWITRLFSESSAQAKKLAKELGGETTLGGFREAVDAISDPEKKYAAFEKEIHKLQQMREDARGPASYAYGPVPVYQNADPAAEEMYKGAIANLIEEQRSITKQIQESKLQKRRDADEGNRANAQQDRPFEDRMKALAAQIDGLKARLSAIGAPEAAQIIAKAFGESQRAIEETNKALERHNVSLTDAQKNQIRQAEQVIASTEAESQWREKFAAATTSVRDRIDSTNQLTAAIGRGYEATKQANVETRLMQELGQHFNDAGWMQSHQSDVANLRAGFGSEFDASHAQQNTEALQKLREQIGLEQALAKAQREGAEAVRQAALAVKLQQLAVTLSASAFKEQAAAEMEAYNAGRQNATASDVAKVEERIEATKRLTTAILAGAAAVRQATLENKLAEIVREGDTPLPGMLFGARSAAAIGEDSATHAQQTAENAVHADRLRAIDEEIARVQEAKRTIGDTLAIEIQLRDLENERLKQLVQESLALKGARDGVRAFFIEMQEDAKSAASIVYESLNSALDKTAANLAKLLTHQKTSWAQEFKEIGESMVQSSIKSGLQKGIGGLSKVLGIDIGQGKPDGTKSNPFWVQLVEAKAGMAQGIPGVPRGVIGPPVLNPDGSSVESDDTGASSGGSAAAGVLRGVSPGLAALLGKLLPSIFGGGKAVSGVIGPPALPTIGPPMAGGGSVSPGTAYPVNEGGYSEYFIPNSSGKIVPHPSSSGSNIVINHNIDARGADLGVMNRISRGLEATHNMAVATAMHAVREHSKRVPAKA